MEGGRPSRDWTAVAGPALGNRVQRAWGPDGNKPTVVDELNDLRRNDSCVSRFGGIVLQSGTRIGQAVAQMRGPDNVER